MPDTDFAGLLARARAGDTAAVAELAERYEPKIRVIARLGETEQQMLELRLQGHGTDEIAARLGLNPVAVRVRFSRRRKPLEESGVRAEWL